MMGTLRFAHPTNLTRSGGRPVPPIQP